MRKRPTVTLTRWCLERNKCGPTGRSFRERSRKRTKFWRKTSTTSKRNSQRRTTENCSFRRKLPRETRRFTWQKIASTKHVMLFRDITKTFVSDWKLGEGSSTERTQDLRFTRESGYDDQTDDTTRSLHVTPTTSKSTTVCWRHYCICSKRLHSSQELCVRQGFERKSHERSWWKENHAVCVFLLHSVESDNSIKSKVTGVHEQLCKKHHNL